MLLIGFWRDGSRSFREGSLVSTHWTEWRPLITTAEMQEKISRLALFHHVVRPSFYKTGHWQCWTAWRIICCCLWLEVKDISRHIFKYRYVKSLSSYQQGWLSCLISVSWCCHDSVISFQQSYRFKMFNQKCNNPLIDRLHLAPFQQVRWVVEVKITIIMVWTFSQLWWLNWMELKWCLRNMEFQPAEPQLAEQLSQALMLS